MSFDVTFFRLIKMIRQKISQWVKSSCPFPSISLHDSYQSHACQFGSDSHNWFLYSQSVSSLAKNSHARSVMRSKRFRSVIIDADMRMSNGWLALCESPREVTDANVKQKEMEKTSKNHVMKYSKPGRNSGIWADPSLDVEIYWDN
jgi:hypothetical protein